MDVSDLFTSPRSPRGIEYLCEIVPHIFDGSVTIGFSSSSRVARVSLVAFEFRVATRRFAGRIL